MVRQLRLSASDAIDDGDTETLREDLIEVFTAEQVERIEHRLDTGDIYEFISELLDHWAGDDVDELFELLETELSEADIALRFGTALHNKDNEDEDEEEEEEEEETVDNNEIIED